MGTDLVFSDVSLLYFIFLGLVLERLWQLSDIKILNGGENLLAADTNNENLR